MPLGRRVTYQYVEEDVFSRLFLFAEGSYRDVVFEQRLQKGVSNSV